MSTLTTIGKVPWTRENVRASLDEFISIYEKRPIRDNIGGMTSPHMFALWFMGRSLSPRLVIESGIWKGQSTWLLETACPDARIVSIDVDLSFREYISSRVEYSDRDFSKHDWSNIEPKETLVFFDDHQNTYDRLQQCFWFGFEHLIFDDNYPPYRGDCYSLKKVFSGTGHGPELGYLGQRRVLLNKIRYRGWLFRRGIAAVLGVTPSSLWIPPSQHDAKMLWKRLRTYAEFPPVFQTERTRWGDLWDQTTYPTPPPLLQDNEANTYGICRDEAVDYTWICYAQLRASANNTSEAIAANGAEDSR